MRWNLSILFLSIGFLFLSACSNDVIQYEAKASDFEEPGFQNKSNQWIVVIDEELQIFGHNSTNKKTSIDKIFESEKHVSEQLFHKKYKNVKIKTKKDKYYITADDGLSLEFKKTGERIIVDEEGAEYYTQRYPDK